MDDIKNTIMDLLISTKRDGIMKLLTAMEIGGFYTAPCSGKFHLCFEGGLAIHSLNVYRKMLELAPTMCPDVPTESIIIVSLLHDLGKMGGFDKPLYIDNVLKSGAISKAEPYKHNPELMDEEHEVRSLTTACKFIDFTEEEYSAILHHNGLFGKLDSSFGKHLYDSNKLAFALHTADMYVSRFEESKEQKEGE